MTLCGVSERCGLHPRTNLPLLTAWSMLLQLCTVLATRKEGWLFGRQRVAGRNRINLTLPIAFPVWQITVTLLFAVISGPAAAPQTVFILLAVTKAIPVRQALIPLAPGLRTQVLQYPTLGARWAMAIFRRRRARTLTVNRPLTIATPGRCRMVPTRSLRTLVFAPLPRRRTWNLERFFLWRRLNLFPLPPLKLIFYPTSLLTRVGVLCIIPLIVVWLST